MNSSNKNERIILPKRHLPYKLGSEGAAVKVLRQEHKFQINDIQFIKYSTSMSKIIDEDKNNGTNGYMVRSLYFDTIENFDYMTKIDGVDSRKKIRLRIYNTDTEFAKLEMKQKQSIYQQKRSININRDDAVQLSKGIYLPLLKYDDPFALECYTLMSTRAYVPKVIVQYNRKAYVLRENQTRITFDSKLAATESCFDIFSNNLCLYPVGDFYNTILEVKYNGFLFSYIKDLLQQFDKSPIAVSKYCMARMVTLGNDY